MGSQDIRDRLEYLYRNVTLSRKELFIQSGMGLRTFQRAIKILLTGGSLSRREGSGRPPKLDGSDRRRLSAIALKNPLLSTRKVNHRFGEKSGKNVSASTALRNLHISGVGKILPRKIPLLTPLHIRKRIAFSNEWKDYHFQDIFLTDESLFQLYRNTVRVWSSKRGKLPVKPTPKFSPKIMVWGALSYRGFYLTIVEGPGTINGPKYCQILEEFLPYADFLYPAGWILEQDGATPHTCNFTKRFFEENNVQFLQWPPNSPDVNPIENVWQILKDYVEKKNPTNIQELRSYILESQETITQEIQVRLMSATARRLNECTATGGRILGTS